MAATGHHSGLRAFGRDIDARSSNRRAAADIDWVELWDRVLDDSRAPFSAGSPAATKHVLQRARSLRGGDRADQLALIYDSPVTDSQASFTYRDLRDAVALSAGA